MPNKYLKRFNGTSWDLIKIYAFDSDKLEGHSASYFATTSHTHGDINNGGTITSSAITTGLASIVVTNSNNAIKRVTDAATIRTFIGAISSSDLNTAIDNAITTALGADY